MAAKEGALLIAAIRKADTLVLCNNTSCYVQAGGDTNLTCVSNQSPSSYIRDGVRVCVCRLLDRQTHGGVGAPSSTLS